ncbi:hypothetical protein JKA74_16155 [Marivirga sp. S37H4]|uniref:Uncharacterized protein n=1 Tax=Marivirga aurantiaca TaxID=2802615 RepID=A0A934X1B3_9BACT|nr:hypothetical protein [Marivirga aurantiaca]MBK6266580.1 hypothetical protein [Marivirga aurantiaca]
MKKLITIISLLIFINQIQLLAQSGWTKPRGEGFFQLSYLFFESDQYFNLMGNQLTTNTFQQQSIILYGEYGITKNFTLITNFPIHTFNKFESTETASGIGDLRLEIKYALPVNFPLSVSIAPELPTAKANNFAQNKQNSFDRINLPAGDGEFNVWTTIAASKSLNDIPFYSSVFASYNYRTSYNEIDFSDQFRIGAEIGYKIANKVWLNARINGLKSVREVEIATDFVRGDGAEFTTVGLGLLVPLKNNWGINLNYTSGNDWIFKKKNIYAAGIFGMGIIYELKNDLK